MKHHGRTLFALSLLILTTAFSGCDEFISIWHGGNGSTSITSYPIQVGNQWTYNRLYYTHNFRPIDSTYQFHPDSFSNTLTMNVTRQLLIPRLPGTTQDHILATEFRSMESDLSTPSYLYYTQASGLLLLQGYVRGSPIQPVPEGPRHAYRLGNRTFRSLREMIGFLEEPLSAGATDSIHREYPPLTSITYPLTTGDQWTFRPQGRPWSIDKRTGSSRWDAQLRLWYYEVRWLYDFNGDGEWDENISITDRISAKGVLSRTLDFLNLLVTTENNPDGYVGYVDVRDEYTVTSMMVP